RWMKATRGEDCCRWSCRNHVRTAERKTAHSVQSLIHTTNVSVFGIRSTWYLPLSPNFYLSERWEPHTLPQVNSSVTRVGGGWLCYVRVERLLTVQLDDELFVDILIDILAARLRQNATDQFVRMGDFEPGRTAAAARGLKRALDVHIVD